MNVANVLKDLNVDSKGSINAAIKQVGIAIDLKPDRLAAANKIIVSLGCPAATKERTAIVLAKGLVEQAIIKGSEYKAEEAMTIVAGKYTKLVDDLPAVYSIKTGVKSLANSETVTKSGRASRSNNEKKARALAICEANKSLNNSSIARIVEKELGITFANSFYYVSRVWVRS